MTEEEIATLQDQLAEAQAEVERLQTIAADREARAAHLEDLSAAQAEGLAHLREQESQLAASLAARDEELAALRQDLSAAQAEVESLRQGLAAAAAKYRDALLASRPEVPPELVGGQTVEEVDQQLEAALRLVAQLKSHLESQAQALRVPSGAPARRPPDLAALSPTEKIVYGLQQRT